LAQKQSHEGVKKFMGAFFGGNGILLLDEEGFVNKGYFLRKHPQIRDQAFDDVKNFCGEFQPLSAKDLARSPQCGSKRLEFSFENTISLQLIFLYHGFEDAFTL